jgi:hypothetical protein
MSGEQPADPYTHWRRRAETAEAEVARLNMEMEAYRQKLTPKDVEAMAAVIKALNAEKAAREVEFPCGHTVAHEEDCPMCKIDSMRSAADTNAEPRA